MLARANNWQALARTLRSSSRPGTFSETDLERYREAWSQPGAFTAMLNWYRAILRRPPERMRHVRITVPTLMIWGVHDVALGRELAQPSIDLCDEGRLVFFEDATHWVQHEEPARVNRLIGEFLE
jgi:pimeloyl-ACP methyl ester carboxylesterase